MDEHLHNVRDRHARYDNAPYAKYYHGTSPGTPLLTVAFTPERIPTEQHSFSHLASRMYPYCHGVVVPKGWMNA